MTAGQKILNNKNQPCLEMRQGVSVLLVLTLLVGLVPSALADGPAKGDLDGANGVTVQDLILLVKHVLGYEVTLAAESDPDINGNGEVDIGDCVALLQILCGSESNPRGEQGELPKDEF